MYIKKGDKVQVLSGKDRGKQGVILRALPAENKVVVEGVSVVKKADRKSTRLNSSHSAKSRMPSSA